ncbi:MAG: hypothetical protein C0P74_000280 [Gammaproteobacteria bacterium]|nr:hypothetical protein [Gammaproteobacteria bacterium]
MSHDSEREPSTFETRTRALFEESVASLDGRTRSRLNQARQAALAVARASRAPFGLRAWMPVAGAAAITALALWMTLIPGGRGGWPENIPLEELEVLADVPTFDLLEDVEFYAWIAEEARNDGSG